MKKAKIKYTVEFFVTRTDTHERLFTEIGNKGSGVIVDKTPMELVIIVCNEVGGGTRITIPISQFIIST